MRVAIFVLLLILVLAGAVVVDGGNLLAYVGIPGLAVAVLVPLSAMLAVWRGTELAAAWRDAFSSGSVRSASRSTAARSARIWAFGEKACYAAGALAWLAAVILVLVYHQPPADTGGFLRALATAFVAPIYAILLAMLCRILGARVLQRGG